MLITLLICIPLLNIRYNHPINIYNSSRYIYFTTLQYCICMYKTLQLQKIPNFWGNCHWDSSLHCFYSLIFFSVKALRQYSMRAAMDLRFVSPFCLVSNQERWTYFWPYLKFLGCLEYFLLFCRCLYHTYKCTSLFRGIQLQ